MLAILILVLLPVGVLLSPDLRSQPAWLIAGAVCVLAVIGLVYGRWRAWQAEQGMVDQRRR